VVAVAGGWSSRTDDNACPDASMAASPGGFDLVLDCFGDLPEWAYKLGNPFRRLPIGNLAMPLPGPAPRRVRVWPVGQRQLKTAALDQAFGLTANVDTDRPDQVPPLPACF
jgi:hypothetical protein